MRTMPVQLKSAFGGKKKPPIIQRGTRTATVPGARTLNRIVFTIGQKIWFTEAPHSARQPRQRYCKMNTGGRTSRRSFNVFPSGSGVLTNEHRKDFRKVWSTTSALSCADSLRKLRDQEIKTHGSRRQDRKDSRPQEGHGYHEKHGLPQVRRAHKIGRASCRESVDLGGRRIIKKKKKK